MAIEFPEAYTIASQMKTSLVGRRFARVEIRPSAANVIKWGFSNLDKVDIAGEEISGVLSGMDGLVFCKRYPEALRIS